MRRATLVSTILPILVAITTVMARPALSIAQAPERAGSTLLVVLVRHAEKEREPADDPPLSALGIARTQALSVALRDAGVTAIITTDWRRTRETARPLATAFGLMPEEVPYPLEQQVGAHAEAVAAKVRQHAGGAVLVVGHSDTVPAIIAALGGPRLPNICESVYANLFVLAPGTGRVRLVQSHYGAADSAPDCP